MLATSCAMYEVVPINDRIDNHRHALQRDLTIIDTRRSLRSVRHHHDWFVSGSSLRDHVGGILILALGADQLASAGDEPNSLLPQKTS